LPRCSIKRTQIIHKVRLKKYPALSNLGSRNTARLGTTAKFFGVKLEE
jgi:hypothetical protein